MAQAGKGTTPNIMPGAGTTRELVAQKSRRGPSEEASPQLRQPRKNGWTQRRRAKFLEVLKATSNVSEAVRAVGLTASGAYDLRRRDPVFASEWAAALEQGYAELEMLLLRQGIFGSETTEIIDDGSETGRKRTKTVHSYPHGMALRLMLSHKSEVDAFRHAQGIDRPGGDAVRAEIQRRLEAVRAREEDRMLQAEGGNGA